MMIDITIIYVIEYDKNYRSFDVIKFACCEMTYISTRALICECISTSINRIDVGKELVEVRVE